jgi:adenosine 3'-phospho 5'-phosphosulfate transporter B2
MASISAHVLRHAEGFEDFFKANSPLMLGQTVLRRLLTADDEFELSKNLERDETISKLKLYLMVGLLVSFASVMIKKMVHNPSDKSCHATFLRKYLHFLCFAKTSRTQNSYGRLPTIETEEWNQVEEGGEIKVKPMEIQTPAPAPKKAEEFSIWKLLFCVFGLLVAYLSWGYFQERLMTVEYPNVAVKGTKDRFKNSEFLVFLNRISGLAIATIALRMGKTLETSSPPYKFLFCSMSNILSAWFQYEALKFITFPMQVLAKSCKVLFTMLMGVAIDQKKFTGAEYVNALGIALGLVIFKYGQESGGETDDSLTAKYFLVGLLLIICYILCDSFTSNWQSRIFREHSISSLQMMQGVNIFSCIFSLLTSTPQIWSTLEFFSTHPSIMFHAGLMSACSGIGQLFIFYTIQKFGAVVFAVAMTTRLICSVLLSIVAFHHNINPMGGVGMSVTFFALAWRVKMKRESSLAKKAGGKAGGS